MSTKIEASSPLSLLSHSAIFDMGTNLYDLRAPTQALMDRIISVKANQVKPKPLVVLMGEHHDMPVTRMMQLSILKSCVDAGLKPAFGVEYPYNLLQKIKYENPLFQHEKAESLLSDPDYLKTIMTPDLFLGLSTEWMEHIAAYCMAQNISVSFNDAARNPSHDDLLDRHDLLTVKTLNMLGVKDSPRYYCGTAVEGILLRNAIMAQNAIDQIERDQPDVLIHMVGSFHVFGAKRDEMAGDLPYRQSLHRVFNIYGADVVSFVPFEPALGVFPDDAPTDTQCVFARGWEDARDEFRDVNDLRKHLNYIARQSGLPQHEELSESDKERKMDSLVKDVKNRIGACKP